MTGSNGSATPGEELLVPDLHGGAQGQLAALYAERQELQDALGVCDAAGVVALVRDLQGAAEAATAQPVAARVDAALLERELGTSDAARIVARVRRLERTFEGLRSALAGLVTLADDPTDR